MIAPSKERVSNSQTSIPKFIHPKTFPFPDPCLLALTKTLGRVAGFRVGKRIRLRAGLCLSLLMLMLFRWRVLLLIRRERGPEGVSGGVRREVGLVPVGLALEKTYEIEAT